MVTGITASAACAELLCSASHLARTIRDLITYPEGQAMKLITAIVAITVTLQLAGSITELALWWM